jgi:hypothetical protein
MRTLPTLLGLISRLPEYARGFSAAWVSTLLASLSGETQAQVSVLDPRFTVQQIGNVPTPHDVAVPPLGSIFGQDVYVLSYGGSGETPPPGAIYAIAQGGAPQLFVEFPILETDPVTLDFPGPTSPYGDLIYVVANNRDFGRPGDCGGNIETVDFNGVITDFTIPVGCNNPFGEPRGQAFASSPSFGNLLYISNSADPIGDIMTVSPSGVVSVFFNDAYSGGNCASHLCTVELAFAPGNAFGSDLYLTDWFGCNCVKRIDSSGSISGPLVSLPDLLDIEFSPTWSAFGEYLYATVPNAIYRMGPDWTPELFASGFSWAYGITFDPTGAFMVATDRNTGNIYKIEPAKPDLVVSDVDTSGLAYDCQTSGVTGLATATVRNIGQGTAAAGMDVAFFEDRDGDGVLGQGDVVLGTTTTNSSIAPQGGEALVGALLSGHVTFAGAPLSVVIDYANLVVEADVPVHGSASMIAGVCWPRSAAMQA